MNGTALRALAAFALLGPATAGAEDGYVHGKDYCYFFDAPPGWTLDEEAGKEQGAPVVFYPQSSSWADATTVIYTRSADFVAGAESDKQRIQGQVDHALTSFRTTYESPESKAGFVKAIEAAHGAKGELWKFTGDRYGNTELAAYFIGQHTLNYFVMTSRDPADFERSMPALIALAQSYREADDCVPCKSKASTCAGRVKQ